MEKKSKTALRIRMVAFMLSITFVYVLILSFVHLYTRSLVTRNENLFLKRSVLYTAALPVPESDEELDSFFNENIIEYTAAGSLPKYRTADGSVIVYTVEGAGLWGVITAHVGLDIKTGKMTGIDFIKQSETPGLGARITENWFREQFRGKKGPFTYVPEGESEKDNQFDAVTGATVTTKAVQDIVNKAAAIHNATEKSE